MLGDGHLSESVEGGKHRATNPCSVLSVQGSSDDNLSLCIILRQVAKLIFESLREVSHESSTASQHNVIVKVNFQIGVTFLDRAVCELGDTSLASIELGVGNLNDSRVEHALSSCDTFALVDFDDLAAWQFVRTIFLG